MPKLKYSAWLTHWSPAGLASFEAHARLLTRVYPVWYNMGDAGAPKRRHEASEELRARVMGVAKQHGLEVWPLISNFNERTRKWDKDVMRLVMGDAATRGMHIQRLLQFVQEDGAQGVDLDYEDLYDTDKPAFTGFVEELARVFHQAGLKVGIAVHAKDSEPGTPGGSRSQDYERLGQACDRVQIMGYDFHWADGEPGPIAPTDWCGRVLAHARTLVDLEKIEWGVPGYGNNWGPGGPATSVDWDQWVSLVKAHGPERRDPDNAELTLRFDGREVWMNDAISLTAKLWQAREAGVGEAAMWVLGVEDPRLWALLDTLPEDFIK